MLAEREMTTEIRCAASGRVIECEDEHFSNDPYRACLYRRGISDNAPAYSATISSER